MAATRIVRHSESRVRLSSRVLEDHSDLTSMCRTNLMLPALGRAHHAPFVMSSAGTQFSHGNLTVVALTSLESAEFALLLLRKANAGRMHSDEGQRSASAVRQWPVSTCQRPPRPSRSVSVPGAPPSLRQRRSAEPPRLPGGGRSPRRKRSPVPELPWRSTGGF